MPAPPSSANDSVPFIAGGKLTPPPLPGANLDHINLRVTDVIRSARFYFSLFGGSTWSPPLSARPDEPATPAILILFNGRVPYLILSQATPNPPPRSIISLSDSPTGPMPKFVSAKAASPSNIGNSASAPIPSDAGFAILQAYISTTSPSAHTQLSARGIASHPDRDGTLTLHDPDGTILRLRTH